MQGALYTGFFVNPLDIASNFSGTILGITNAFGTIPGWLAPLIAGALTRESVSYFVFRSHPFKTSAFFRWGAEGSKIGQICQRIVAKICRREAAVQQQRGVGSEIC